MANTFILTTNSATTITMPTAYYDYN